MTVDQIMYQTAQLEDGFFSYQQIQYMEIFHSSTVNYPLKAFCHVKS